MEHTSTVFESLPTRVRGVGVLATLFVLGAACVACGGSASETPMPLEPVPHSGPEPTVGDSPASKKPGETDASEEESKTNVEVGAAPAEN